MINLRTSSRVFLYSCEKLGMRCSYNYWQFSENECAPFSKYIYEQKFEASILFFSLSLLLVSLLRSFLCAACAIFPSFSSSNFPWCGENWFNGTISPSAGNVAFYDATRRATRSRSTFASLSAHLDLHRRSLGQESSTTWKLTFFNHRLSFFWESETLETCSFSFLLLTTGSFLLLRIEIVFMKSKSRYCVPSIETSLESYNLYDLAFQVLMIRMLKKLHGYARWYCRSFQVLKSSKENAQPRKSYVTAINIL